MAQAAPHKASKRRRRLVALAITLVVAGGIAYVTKNNLLHARFQTVVEGEVYRSYQPSPDEQREWTTRYGIRSILNLRGDHPGLPHEAATTQATGVALYTFRFSARSEPSREELLRLIDVIETARRPILIHCQYGVDRTGMVSVLAAMAIGHQSYHDARADNLPLIIKPTWGPTYISNLLEEYDRYCQAHSLNRDDWGTFKKWAAEDYQPPAKD